MAYGLLRYTLLPFFRRRIKKISGVDNLPKKGGYIIVANHQSWIDAAVIISALHRITGRKIYFIASTGKYKSVGAIPIDPKDKDSVIDTALEYLEKDNIVGIFPGGQANQDVVHKGKTGAARLAIWSGLPILPMRIKGTRGNNPVSAIGHYMTSNIFISIGPQLEFQQKSRAKTTKELLVETTATIMSSINKLPINE